MNAKLPPRNEHGDYVYPDGSGIYFCQGGPLHWYALFEDGRIAGDYATAEDAAEALRNAGCGPASMEA